MTPGLESLSPRQRELVLQWLPDAVVEEDYSWDLSATTVLRLRQAESELILKAGADSDHHIRREIHAHLSWLGPWTIRGRAAVLRHFDAEAGLLVTSCLPGRLVLGTDQVDDPGLFRQAGQLLALLHAQATVQDDGYETRENCRSLAWLSGPHRIAPEVEKQLRVEIASWSRPAATLVPTHGDWQPRNWLIHEGVVSVIDFGRSAMRPAMSDLGRLAAQDFGRLPALEEAFLAGYGSDPREVGAWHRTRVREAIGTAAWAHRAGDEAFEAQGHRMIAEALFDVRR